METISEKLFYHKIGHEEKAPDDEEYRMNKQKCDEAYEMLNRNIEQGAAEAAE